MKYIVIILLAVSVTLLIVHQLANKVFGFSLHLKPLLWCASCAVLLSAVLPKLIVEFVGLQGALVLLALVAVAFAYVVAYFDGSTGYSQGQRETVTEYNGRDDFVEEPIVSLGDEDDSIVETRALLVNEDGTLMDASDTMAMINDIQCKSDSLDDLMDFAFEQKGQKNLRQALKAFQKALNLYHDNETALFLIAEIGGILKEQGSYEDAIKVLSEGRDIAKIRFDKMLEEEFVNIVAYLRIVENVLLEQRLGFIPFSNIPVDVVAQIDSEFSEWRRVK